MSTPDVATRFAEVANEMIVVIQAMYDTGCEGYKIGICSAPARDGGEGFELILKIMSRDGEAQSKCGTGIIYQTMEVHGGKRHFFRQIQSKNHHARNPFEN